MGFYHGGGQPPEDPDKPMGWGDTFAIIFAVFRVMAVPVGILIGAILGITIIGLLFFTHWALGMTVVLILLGFVGWRAWYEWRHPPTLDSIDRR